MNFRDRPLYLLPSVDPRPLARLTTTPTIDMDIAAFFKLHNRYMAEKRMEARRAIRALVRHYMAKSA